jgi:tyrosine aminotransferase
MESKKAWGKHVPSKRTDVHNLMRAMVESLPKNPHKPLIPLGIGKSMITDFLAGEPTKANGFDLPPVINEAIIE